MQSVSWRYNRVPQSVCSYKRVFFLTTSAWRNGLWWSSFYSLSRLRDHTHLDRPQSVRLLWTSDQPDTNTSTWQHTTQVKYILAPGRILTCLPNKRAASDARRRPHGYWDRKCYQLTVRNWLVPQNMRRNRQVGMNRCHYNRVWLFIGYFPFKTFVSCIWVLTFKYFFNTTNGIE